MPVDPNSFHSRRKLPDAFCGLRDQELSEKIGIEGCIFIHAGGFIGGHQTKEGVIQMAIEVFLCFECESNLLTQVCWAI